MLENRGSTRLEIQQRDVLRSSSQHATGSRQVLNVALGQVDGGVGQGVPGLESRVPVIL